MAYFNVFVFSSRKIPWVPVSIENFNPDSIYPPSDVVYQINAQFNTPEERLNVDKQYFSVN